MKRQTRNGPPQPASRRRATCGLILVARNQDVATASRSLWDIRCLPMADGLDDAVERQVVAYNNHDVDAFVACYAENVVIEDDRRQTSLMDAPSCANATRPCSQQPQR